MPAVQAAVAQPNLASPASPAAPPVAVATDGAAVAAPAPTSTPASAPAQVGEATALLRMLSMSATERPATVDSAVRVAVATKGKDTDSAGTDAAVRKVDVDLTVDTPKAAVATAPATASAPTSATVSAPVNLSASLGQQVIDMGAGGQWIDDLAKEIATLANGSGQGSFRLSPEHLGPMRVDIRNGDTGAQVRLTVETQAAETALSQDSDTLKADARLSAIKIGEVTVERVHKLAEPSRSDASNGQNTGGQGNGSSLWQQGSAQAGLGQGMDQGQRQAASQQQAGNQQPAGKVSGGETVLGQAESADRVVDDGRGGGRQARYA
jgi:flagellar hook-length control protein FliK